MRALGIFGAANGLGAIAGQVVGGLLIQGDLLGLRWRPVFLINLPVGLLAILGAMAVLPGGRPGGRSKMDPVGVALAAVTVLLLVVPLLEGRDLGWPAWMIACLVAVVPAAGTFLAHEHRLAARGGSPLLPPDLFRNPGFANGVPIAALFIASYAGYLIILALYLQVGLGFSPLQAALTYVPSAVGMFITSLLAPRLVPLLGRSVLTLGYVIAALGLLATAATAAAAGGALSGWELAPTLFIAGLGNGLGMTPLIGTVISALRPEETGAGSGVVTTTLQIGNAVGLAVISLLFFGLLDGGQTPAAYAIAFARTLPASALLLLAAAVLVQRLPRAPQQPANSLIERLPGWASGFAYSIYLMTGGWIGDQLFREILGQVAERRIRRTHEAPMPPGEFLAYHFKAGAGDQAWLNYLVREALAYGARPVPHESDRVRVIQEQVEEMRRRQEVGLLAAEFDPALLRLLAFALASYPRLLPQITRMTTGRTPDDPSFVADWERLLRAIGERLRPPLLPGLDDRLRMRGDGA